MVKFVLTTFLSGLSFAAVASEPAADLVIYGSSPAAITAAVKAKDMGLRAVIVSPEKHLGGLSVSGLGYTDAGNTAAIGGLAREFYHRIYNAYRNPAAWKWERMEDFRGQGQSSRAIDHAEKAMWTFEPHVAERVFVGWLAEKGIEVFRGEFLDRAKGVEKAGGRIVSIRTLGGKRYVGRYFIDATYEGDLMAAAGVPYRVGREACSEFGETWNGNQVGILHHSHHFRDWRISPYRMPGDPRSGLCAEVDESAPGTRGEADRRVQAYCYRLCLTDEPKNRIPFAKPEGYDPARYELLRRVYEKGYDETFAKFDRIANRKTDSNNHGPMNFDYLGGSYEWPEASYARREELARAHRNYQQGLLYFLANDPGVPREVREKMSRWGLAADEFGENGGWPYYIYVREGRRMRGAYVMTERDCLGEPRHAAQGAAWGSVGMGSYAIDSHNVRRYVTREGFVQNEGDVGVHPKRPYSIDYGSIVPRAEDCQNLLVPVALSATHTAFGSIRMEPVFMVLGESAATAAALAARDGRSVQDVSYAELGAQLRADGQILTIADPLKRGDRIVFLGDSITHQGYYLKPLDEHLVNGVASMRLRAYSAGIGGDTTDLCLDRLGRDVDARRPSVIAVMLGMNDCIMGKSRGEFAADFEKLASVLRKRNPEARFVWITPSPYDSGVVLKSDRLGAHPERAARLREYSAFIREWQRREGGTLVDLNAAMERFNAQAQKERPSFTLCGSDRIHPREIGGYFIARVILRDLGLSSWREPATLAALETEYAAWKKANDTPAGRLIDQRAGEEASFRTLHMIRWQLETLQKRDADDFAALEKLEASFEGRHGQFEDRVRRYLKEWPSVSETEARLESLWDEAENLATR